MILVTLLALVPVLGIAAGCGGNGGGSTGGSKGGSTTGSTTGAVTSTGSGSSVTSSVTSSGETSSSQTSTSSGAGGQTSGDWPTYHHDAARSGAAADQGTLGAAGKAWTSPPLDGPVYAQPLVVGRQVFVATEGNTVYALDVSNGSIVWQRNLGEPVPADELPCGNIDPSGITGTPVIDQTNAILYVVANLRSGPHHELFALDLPDGAVRWHQPVDPPGLDPAVEQQRGAVALSGGRVFVPFGGLYGDCGRYKGAVVSISADGSGSPTSYVVPTTRMAGIWNPAGPAVDAAGDLWVTTGNSAGQDTFDFGNALIRLTPDLKVMDYFAPADWRQLNAGDVDLGSLGPVLLENGRVMVVGKDGTAYLVDAANLGQVGKPLTSLDIGSSAFGVAATTGSMVFVPCARALVAVKVSGDSLSVAWRVDGGSGTPIFAAGAVWALGYDGKLRAIDPDSGTVRFSAQMSDPVSRFISPCAAAGMIYVPDGQTVVAFTLR